MAFSLLLLLLVATTCKPSSGAFGHENALPTEIKTAEDDMSDGNADVDVSSEIDDTLPEFVASNQWQKVLKGQALPAGLHYRINLATGKKEAKLLDENDRRGTDPSHKVVEQEGKFLSPEKVKAALKEFMAANKDDVQDREMKEKALKKKFRSYLELKKDFEGMNLKMQTDVEAMAELVGRLNETRSTEDMTTILTDLEYYVHQVDNARDFLRMDALGIVLRLMNSSDPGVRAGAVTVIGAALQSNPSVQIFVYEAGTMDTLLRVLALDGNITVRRKAIYALSALIRHFPYAQQKFYQAGGLSALTALFTESGTEELRIKAVTLIHDLISEQMLTKQHADPKRSMDREKLRQYASLPLLKSVVSLNWCNLVPTLLKNPSHDAREKVLQCMNALADSCATPFSSQRALLAELRREYAKLQEDPELGSYYADLLNSIDRILDTVNLFVTNTGTSEGTVKPLHRTTEEL